MRQKRELLKHHGRLMTTELAKLRRRHLHHIHAIHQHLTGGRIDQPVDVADQCGLAGTRQAHDDLNAAGRNGDVDIAKPEHMAILLVQLLLRQTVAHGLHMGRRVGTENLVEIADFNTAETISHGRPPGASGAACHRPG